MFGNDRDQLRRTYFEAWKKFREGLPMEPLEHQIAAVIEDHPEYHKFFENEEKALGREFLPELGETNPFMHLGLHLALRDQVATRRPAGIEQVHAALSRALGSRLEAEHRMMDCLADALYRAQREGREPDEQAYLQSLRTLQRTVCRD